MNKRDALLKTLVITIGSITISIIITYLLCQILGSNHFIQIKYTLLIAFVAPLIITPVICMIFIDMNNKLSQALNNIRTLSTLLPICSSCKKVRDDKGYWSQIESYISAHTNSEFTHGICPECSEKIYGFDCNIKNIELDIDGNLAIKKEK